MEIPPIRKVFIIEIKELAIHYYEGTETQLVEERHYTDKELADHYNWIDGDRQAKLTKKIWNDRPKLCSKDSETIIYKQTFDELPLAAIIKAANGLTRKHSR